MDAREAALLGLTLSIRPFEITTDPAPRKLGAIKDVLRGNCEGGKTNVVHQY